MNRPGGARKGALEPLLADGTAVKIIGLGGVGGIAARYLSMFLASLERDLRLVLIDGDDFEPSNTTRMFFSDHGNKAAVTRTDLRHRFTESSLMLTAVEQYVEPSNIDRLIQNGDVVILAVDNHATRKLISEHCRTRLEDVCLISGGNDGVGRDGSGQERRGTYGNCQVYLRRAGQDLSPPLTRFHPEISEPADSSPAEESCTELIKSVPQILFANLATASAILNAFWLHCCSALHYSELSFDIADGLMSPMPLPAPRPERHREMAVADEPN